MSSESVNWMESRGRSRPNRAERCPNRNSWPCRPTQSCRIRPRSTTRSATGTYDSPACRLLAPMWAVRFRSTHLISIRRTSESTPTLPASKQWWLGRALQLARDQLVLAPVRVRRSLGRANLATIHQVSSCERKARSTCGLSTRKTSLCNRKPPKSRAGVTSSMAGEEA